MATHTSVRIVEEGLLVAGDPSAPSVQNVDRPPRWPYGREAFALKTRIELGRAQRHPKRSTLLTDGGSQTFPTPTGPPSFFHHRQQQATVKGIEAKSINLE